MSLRDLFPELQLEDDVRAQIKEGRCPCKGSRSLPSVTSKSGYRDCICKVILRLKEVLGPEMDWLEGRKFSGKSSPRLYKYRGKNIVYTDTSKRSDDAARELILLHVKFILCAEFYKHEMSIINGDDPVYPVPRWAWIQSLSVVDFSLKTPKSENDVLMLEGLLRVPFLVLAMGFEAVGNNGYNRVFPSFLNLRSERGLATWVYTRKLGNDLKTIFNQNTLDWLIAQPQVKATPL